MPEPERVTVSISGGIADVKLNRPDKLNALDIPTFQALADAAAGVAEDRSVRAVVISGEGRGFCAGLDISAFGAIAGGGGASGRLTDRLPGKITNLFQQAAHGWAELPMPVIAAVHGVALGGGIQIALAADIRIVAPDVRMSVLEIRWGLIPDMTGTDSLLRLVPLDVAKELTWTGRIVGGEVAVSLGLATRVSDDPYKDAMALASDIASRSPVAIRAGKRLMESAGRVSRHDQYVAESKEMEGLIGGPDQREAVAAYMEKRDPVFADPA
jgi:enoyl-CoA hydratase/carnithine racemase